MIEQGNTDKKRFSRERKNPFAESSLTGTGKLPPQAIELEEAVLGALMLEKDALSAVVDILRPESFYKDAHQRIFNAIQNLFAKSEPIDILTVTNELRKNGELEFAGGAFYITELTNRVASAANIEFHARIISQKFIQRELIKISSDIIQQSYEDTTDIFELLDNAEKNLFGITENNLRRSSQSMSELIRQSIRKMEELKDQEEGLTGVPSGFTKLDRLTGGWQKSELVIIAARPGMGKTAFVMSTARNAAVIGKKPVAIFSLEMSSLQLVNRLLSGEAELPSEKLRRGTLEDYEWAQLTHKISKLSDAPIYIDDTPALNVFELRAKCRRLKSQFDIQLIIIDYLQLMSGSGDKNGNREQEISNISRSLKSISKELDVAVIALSQLNRSVETRGGAKRPMLSDLRESGSIEQDADMVLFIYRPEYYGITQDESGNDTQGIAEIIIAKNRNGALETVPLRYINKFVKFTDLEEDLNFTPFTSITPSDDFNPIMIRPSKANDFDEDAPF